MAERLRVYVDGFNLYHGLHDQARCRLLWLDLAELARLLRPRSSLVGVTYFTAPVLNDQHAASRQGVYQSALLAHLGDQIQIVQGRYQAKSKSCRVCKATWTHYEEKETDVNIAVSLVADAARNEMDAALLVSADSDLSPAVKAARLIKSDLFIAAGFPPSRFSAELKALMPASFHINVNKVRQAQLPTSVVDAAGRTFDRPPKWAP